MKYFIKQRETNGSTHTALGVIFTSYRQLLIAILARTDTQRKCNEHELVTKRKINGKRCAVDKKVIHSGML